MADLVLTAEIRKGAGKGVARKLRAAGKVPAVVYGRGRPSVPIALDPKALERLLIKSEAGLNTLIDLHMVGDDGEQTTTVLVRELQRDPVERTLLHVDLYQVDLTKTVTVSVPIHLKGRPHGVELGGILDQALRELELECLPRNIPDEIELDVSALEIGDVIHVRDLPLPEGVELLTDPDLGVAQVLQPAAEEEEAVAAPEVAVEGAAPAEGAAPGEGAEEKAGE